MHEMYLPAAAPSWDYSELRPSLLLFITNSITALADTVVVVRCTCIDGFVALFLWLAVLAYGGPATKISGFLSTCRCPRRCKDLLDTTFFGSVDRLRRISSSQTRRIDSTSGDSMKILILLLSFVATTVAFSPPLTAHHAAHAVCGSNLRLTVRRLSSTPFSVGGPSDELLELFSRQVTQEFSASQLYLSASIWFNRREWEGMAAYMLAESAEERGHALDFVDFANKRNIPIKLETIEAPNAQWESPEEVWADILKLEETNTASLLRVAEAANSCQDYAVLAFLNPFHVSAMFLLINQYFNLLPRPLNLHIIH